MQNCRLSVKVWPRSLVAWAVCSQLGCSAGQGAIEPTTPAVESSSSSADQAANDQASSDQGRAESAPQATSNGIAAETDAPSAVAAGTGPAESAPLPAGTKVLHVGDSFAGALGLPLSKDLEAAGVRSILKHTDSSYLTTWAWERDLQDYLWKFNPDLVIVTLGANELAIAEPEQRERTVKKIVSTIGDRPCVWVAIPLWNGKQNGLMDVIERSVSPCIFMDTNELLDVAKMPRISDGIHPTSEARDAWADFVFDWLKDHRVGGEKPWAIRP